MHGHNHLSYVPKGTRVTTVGETQVVNAFRSIVLELEQDARRPTVMTERRLKEFEEVQRARGALTARPLGVIPVPLDEIVGSVGRARYFPKGLRRGSGLTPSRVKRLVAALDRGEMLPAVELYRIGARVLRRGRPSPGRGGASSPAPRKSTPM